MGWIRTVFASWLVLFGCGNTTKDPEKLAAASGSAIAASTQSDAHAPDATRFVQSSKLVTSTTVDKARRVLLAKELADIESSSPGRTLLKQDLRAPMHTMIPLLASCYQIARRRQATIDGVVNTKITVASAAGLGTVVTVRGFETSGALGESPKFRQCVTDTIESIVLPPAGDGTLDTTYPITFAPQPPDNVHVDIVAHAKQSAASGNWRQAFEDAEHGLELTSLDGTLRRPLIEIAGLAACHLRDGANARRYYSLAAATYEAEIKQTCLQAHIEL